jgi:hypothetical protein
MYYTPTVLAVKREWFTREPPPMVYGTLFANKILPRLSLPQAIFAFLTNPIFRIYRPLLLNIDKKLGSASLGRKLRTWPIPESYLLPNKNFCAGTTGFIISLLPA